MWWVDCVEGGFSNEWEGGSGVCLVSACSIVIINTKRTKYRTTLTTTHVKYHALLAAVSLSGITVVPYGPTVNKPNGDRLMGRVSTLKKRVNVTTSTATIRVHVLGHKGKPTMCTLHTRSSGNTCRHCVGGIIRGASGLSLGRIRIVSVVIRSKGYINVGARLSRRCQTGTIVLYANACLSDVVVVNSAVCSNNPGNVHPSIKLSTGLGGRKLRVLHFGAKAPSHMSEQDLRVSGVRLRRNSPRGRTFSFVDRQGSEGGQGY